MKKIVSLLLVFVFMFALSTAAYADNGEWDPNIVGDDGHLHNCAGGSCDCMEILVSAEYEYRTQNYVKQLRVMIDPYRDSAGLREDTIIAEIMPVYNNEMLAENERYLNANEAIKALLTGFYDEKKLARDLYRPDAFIHNQVMSSYWYLVGEHENGGSTDVEYRLVQANASALSGLEIGLYDESKDAEDGKKYVFSRDKVGNERYSPLEYEVALKAGGFYVQLPEGYGDRGFTLGLSFNDNGSVRVLLAVEEANLIPGARISLTVAAAAADADEVYLLDADGNLSPLEDAGFSGKRVNFVAPTGDDVFVLGKK